MTSAAPVFLTAIFVVALATAFVDPVRLPLLLIPGSFLLAAHGIGALSERILRSWAMDIPADSSILLLITRLSVGVSFLGFATVVLGLLEIYQLAGILVVLGILWSVVNGLRAYRQRCWIRPTSASIASGVVMGIVWSIVWLWTTIPPTFYDELAYHLPIAQYALRTGALPAFPWSFFTYMPHLSDLFLGWGLALGGEIGARAMHLAFWIAIWIAGWAFIEIAAAPERNQWVGYIFAAAFASSSTFLFLGALPFSETALTFAVLASAALIALSTGPPLWLPVGLLWGLAISIKLSGVAWVLAGAAAALAIGWPLRSLFKAGCVTAVLALPWWGRAWWLTGNPLYPFGYQWLGGRYWDDDIQARLQGDLPSLPEPFSVMTFLQLPLDMVTAPDRFGSASECGPLAVIAVCIMGTLPLWPLIFRLDPMTCRQCYAAGLFIFLTSTFWVITSTTTRLFAPALLLGLSLIVRWLINIPKVLFIGAIIVLTACGTWGTIRFVSVHSRVFSSQKVALGQEPTAEFASRTVDHYDAAAFVREYLQPNAKLLFLGESRPFYFNRTALASYPFHEHPLNQWIRETTSAEELLRTLRAEGFTHIILNTSEFRRLHDRYQVMAFTGPDALLYDQRLKAFPQTLTARFAKHNVYVLEIPIPPLAE